MEYDYDICPKCGCNLWKEHARMQKKEQKKKYPDNCFCFSHGKIKRRDTSKDKFIEDKKIKEWNGPLTNTYQIVVRKVYKCHLCGKKYIYPELVYG